jgi:hypothetical protein
MSQYSGMRGTRVLITGETSGLALAKCARSGGGFLGDSFAVPFVLKYRIKKVM